MKKGNLFVNNKIIARHIGQHVVPFRETDNVLLQPKLSSLLYLKLISKWIALFVSYLAYTCSQLRHMCSNNFCFRNLKSRLNSFEKTDAIVMSYLKVSDMECKTQCIAEWGDSKSELFVYLPPKPFSHKDRLEN